MPTNIAVSVIIELKDYLVGEGYGGKCWHKSEEIDQKDLPKERFVSLRTPTGSVSRACDY